MSNLNLMVSTCGTSILTNNTSDELRKALNRYANVQSPAECADNERMLIETHIAQRQQEILVATDQKLSNLSAEMNALLQFYQSSNTGKDMHILLHTDTWLGRKTGEVLRALLEKKGFVVDTPIIKDLRTQNLTGFQLALSDLVKWASETFPAYRKKQYHIVFNLTGGFKSIQGFMQTLAMLYADESIYIFETGNELLRLPRLPVKMDAEQVVRDNLGTLRQLALGLPSPKLFIDKLPETFLLHMDDQTVLSPWGELVWQECKANIYRTQLYNSPSNKIRFTDHFKKSIADLETDRIRQINERIDDLTRFVETGENIKRLSFHGLQGKPYASSTHEFYAFSDDAKRVYCHYDKEVVILDALDKHL